MSGVQKVAHFDGEAARLCVGKIEVCSVESIADLWLVVHMEDIVAEVLREEQTCTQAITQCEANPMLILQPLICPSMYMYNQDYGSKVAKSHTQNLRSYMYKKRDGEGMLYIYIFTGRGILSTFCIFLYEIVYRIIYMSPNLSLLPLSIFL